MKGAVPSIFEFPAHAIVEDTERAEKACRRDVPASSMLRTEPPPASGVQEDEEQHQADILGVSDGMMEEVPDVMMGVKVKEVKEPGNRGLLKETDGTRSDFLDCAHFKYFFQILGPATTSLVYKCQSLEAKEELLLTLMKLHLNKDDVELGFFFGKSETAVCHVFHTWLNFMYYQLRELNLWLPRNIVDEYMSADFKKKFPRIRVIIDGTEIGIDRPGTTKVRTAIWSSYKNKNTLRMLVEISPKGAVTYISDAYRASPSERQIVERSDPATAQDLFCKGDRIMCYKGFTVKDLFCHKGVSENTPTFLKGVSQLPAEKVASDRKISCKSPC